VSNRPYKLTALAFFALLFAGPFARAQEKPVFVNPDQMILGGHILKAVQKTYPEQRFQIGKIDLNHDGENELIFKTTNCRRPETKCLFIIMAQSELTPAELGKVEAYNLLIDEKTTNGVRNLLSYENPLNDFDYEVYNWDAQSKSYIRENE